MEIVQSKGCNLYDNHMFTYFIFAIIIEINKCQRIHFAAGNNPELFIAFDIVAANILCNGNCLHKNIRVKAQKIVHLIECNEVLTITTNHHQRTFIRTAFTNQNDENSFQNLLIK